MLIQNTKIQQAKSSSTVFSVQIWNVFLPSSCFSGSVQSSDRSHPGVLWIPPVEWLHCVRHDCQTVFTPLVAEEADCDEREPAFWAQISKLMTVVSVKLRPLVDMLEIRTSLAVPQSKQFKPGSSWLFLLGFRGVQLFEVSVWFATHFYLRYFVISWDLMEKNRFFFSVCHTPLLQLLVHLSLFCFPFPGPLPHRCSTPTLCAVFLPTSLYLYYKLFRQRHMGAHKSAFVSGRHSVICPGYFGASLSSLNGTKHLNVYLVKVKAKKITWKQLPCVCFFLLSLHHVPLTSVNAPRCCGVLPAPINYSRPEETSGCESEPVYSAVLTNNESNSSQVGHPPTRLRSSQEI